MSKGTITQRGKSWMLKYDIGRDPLTGQRRVRYATVRGAKVDAQRELRRLLSALDNGSHVDPSKITVGEWLRQWLDTIAVHSASPKTLERYREIVQNHLAPHIGHHRLQKLDATTISAFYSKCLTNGRRDGKGGLSAQTVRHFDRVLNVAMKAARKHRKIAINPVEDVDRPKVERQEVRILDEPAVKRLLTVAASSRHHTLILLTLTTGLRRGEVLALRWRDLDLDGASLSVVRSVEQTQEGIRFKPPKTRRSRRTIALPAVTVEKLRQHRAAQARERLALGLGRDDDGLVFTRADGEPMSPRNFSKELTRIAARANCAGITFHALRHTHLSQLLAAGVHPKVASERAGHASVGITLDVYSHVIPGLQEDAAAKVDAAMRKALGE